MKSELRNLIRSGEHETALSLLLGLTPESALEDIQYAATALAKIPAETIAARVPLTKRFAIMSGATTQFVTPLIRLFALRRGVNLEIYESDYGLFEQEIRADSAELHEFRPDVIHFHLCARNAAFAFDEADPATQLNASVQRFRSLYGTAVEQFGCPVIADNFVLEPERPYGGLDVIHAGTRNNLLRALNHAVAASLPKQVFQHDAESLSANLGKQSWHDPRLYNSAKCAISFDCQPHYADSLAATVAAIFGMSKKCLVLDLDNTLWGGVIGDDDLGGIVLGTGIPAGEAFVEFQQYVKVLRDRGILLAVVSKNEMENALLPFRKHADMVLSEEDISCFIANWEPKHENIREVARRLNIGIDSLVFFDDNPAEREIVRVNCPQVVVHEVPEDPSLYTRSLDRARWFDSVSITAEDRTRAEFFRNASARDQLEQSTASYDDYLAQLEMSADVEAVTEQNLPRTTQLINKTNQFNLTTIRTTEAEVRAFADSDRHYTSTTRLSDKFGDNGLISVVIGRLDEADNALLDIDFWLMSCRVLKRGVEVLDMELLLEHCRKNGIERVRGRYIPTAKNKLVADHYRNLGFSAAGNDGDTTIWLYDTEQPLRLEHHIAIRR